jgi:isopentenyl phosphate kinase
MIHGIDENDTEGGMSSKQKKAIELKSKGHDIIILSENKKNKIVNN